MLYNLFLTTGDNAIANR